MNRLLLLRCAVVVVFVVFVARLYQVQLVDTGARRYDTSDLTRSLPIRPLRGEVFASDGTTLLAESVTIYTAAVRPADLDQAAPPGSPRRAEVFAQLSRLLNITSTLTISPVEALERDAALANDLNWAFGAERLATAQHGSVTPPLQLVVPPSHSAGAVELLRRYPATVQLVLPNPSEDLPSANGQLLETTLTGLGGALAISSTLAISPATSLQDDPALRNDVVRLLGPAALAQASVVRTYRWATLDVLPSQVMAVLKLSLAYSETLTLTNPIAQQVEQDIPAYQTLPIKQDIPREVALVLRENAASLPGVVVEQDYRRRYPLSGEVQSLSHLLGYIGRIQPCQLVRRNPARSWSESLFDSLGHAPACGGMVRKQIDPQSLGRPRYLNNDRLGQGGIEASYETELRGQLGTESFIVNAQGQPMSAPQVIQPARDGADLVLTIDVPFQRQVEQIMRNWIAEGERRRLDQSGQFAYRRDFQPIRSGAAVALEVQTGRVLAMVSWPSYDNNIWVDPARSSELIDILSPPAERLTETLQLAVLTDRTVAGLYPPGSTLKQFDAAVALQKGRITPETRIHDPGMLVVQNEYNPESTRAFPNAGRRAYGDINVSDALMVSSNVFFMSVIGGNKENVVNLTPEEQIVPEGLRPNEFAEGLRWFGFGEPTGVKLSGELEGLVPTPAWKEQVQNEGWTTGDTYNMAIGQGNMLVTPLQLARAAAAVANGGTLYRPQLVKEIRSPDGTQVTPVEPQVDGTVPVDPRYFGVIREGMRRSVTEGVNHAARDECSGLQIAGKTGTAEFGREIIPGEFQTHSWFAGFAPYDNPQVLVVVLSEGTGGLGDGSATIAVPAVTQIMQAYFQITPPNPLPPTCQQGLPPLPGR